MVPYLLSRVLKCGPLGFRERICDQVLCGPRPLPLLHGMLPPPPHPVVWLWVGLRAWFGALEGCRFPPLPPPAVWLWVGFWLLGLAQAGFWGISGFGAL